MQSRILAPEDLLDSLYRHPRVSFQELVAGEEQLTVLRDTLRGVVAFGDASYRGIVSVLDWDHRLPSQMVLLRIYAFYSQTALLAGKAEFQARSAHITSRDAFPEFDLPDFEGIGADEAYEVDVQADGTASRMRLVSPWRREVQPSSTRTALRAVRTSKSFHDVLAETKGSRPQHLGDLEAIGWTPPCESGVSVWTIDVWYMTHLDTAFGKGRSFLVDPAQERVVATREFVIRSS